LEFNQIIKTKGSVKPPLRLLFIGDIVGDEGVRTVEKLLPEIIISRKIDFCIANAENSHEGRGTNEFIIKKLYKAGVNVVTGGDHSFDKHLIFPYMSKDRNMLRPMNYPKGVPGFGYGCYEHNNNGLKIGVINLRGQAFFNNPIRCPFTAADIAIEEISKETQIIFVDFHAEASAEKYAMSYYLDGRVSAICGTHTHVQTADEKILAGGTGYLTDVGFTGPHSSVIGMDISTALSRFLLQTPQKYVLGKGGLRLNAVIFEIDTQYDEKLRYGKTLSIERLNIPCELPSEKPNGKPSPENVDGKEPLTEEFNS